MRRAVVNRLRWQAGMAPRRLPVEELLDAMPATAANLTSARKD